MKYLLLLLVVLLLAWAWRQSRRAKVPPPQSPQASAPETMGTCLHCGVHLPASEAVRGEKGLYCSTAHRIAAADRNPP
jgi:uncharacterized protein